MKKWIVAGVIALLPVAAQAAGRSGPTQTQFVAPEVVAPAPTKKGRHLDGFTVLAGGQKVMASFYGHGERLAPQTATGEVFNPRERTAASRTLPFGTMVRVAYQGNEVVVRINDRGPATWTGRSLDLSYGAALKLGLVPRGAGPVMIAVLN